MMYFIFVCLISCSVSQVSLYKALLLCGKEQTTVTFIFYFALGMAARMALQLTFNNILFESFRNGCMLKLVISASHGM